VFSYRVFFSRVVIGEVSGADIRIFQKSRMAGIQADNPDHKPNLASQKKTTGEMS